MWASAAAEQQGAQNDDNQRPATMCEAFQRTAAIDPDAVALRTPGGAQTLTWREYAGQVRRVAAGLAGLGVLRGDTVSLMMANRVEFYPLEVGAQHVGATSFSVSTRRPPTTDLPVRQRRHQGRDLRGAVRRPHPCQRRAHRAHRLHRRFARRNTVGGRPLPAADRTATSRRRGGRCNPTTSSRSSTPPVPPETPRAWR